MSNTDVPVLLIVGVAIVVVLVVVALALSIRIVPQATVAVVTRFGKYHRILTPGLGFIIPLAENASRRVEVQNQTAQFKFSVITNDQAAVQFTATLIFAVSDADEETIQRVAYKFVDHQSFSLALNAAVEASVREYVSSKLQSEILGARSEIVTHAKNALDTQVADWGYTIGDLQLNDIQFDQTITDSMNRVVAAKNQKTAAEFEGEALLITKTKAAEAEGAFIRISAENEKTAAKLRGEGLAEFRKAMTSGIKESAAELAKANVDPSIISLAMWTETLSKVAAEGSGNTILLDGNVGTLDETMRRFQALGLSRDSAA